MKKRWFNPLQAVIRKLQVNYLTGPFFYALAFILGKAVCGYSNSIELPDWMNFATIKSLFLGKADVFISLLTGSFILGVPLAIGSYCLARSILSWKLIPQLS